METHLHSWQFHLEAQHIWEAMYRDCEQAVISIEMEQYIFGNDALGHLFMELFIRKAAQGVKVFIICDKFGSVKFFGSSLIRKLRRNGGRFFFYNPITRWNIVTPWRWFPRTHVKALLVDSAIAYAGSACMAAHMAHWRDTQIRFTGPAVTYVRQAFDQLERGLLHHKNPILAKAPPKEEPFRYVINQPTLKNCRIYNELAEAISKTEHYIYIAAAFFVPHLHFFDLLKEASRRGVDIRLLVPEKSDVPLADWICLSYGKRLFDAGVRLYHYQAGNLHCKTAIIDDRWATVGSANFDVLSFFHNREANLIITDTAAVAEVKRQFLDDLAHSREITPEIWDALPLRKKLTGYLARALKVFF
jgi:cardiolipin synthase A/B